MSGRPSRRPSWTRAVAWVVLALLAEMCRQEHTLGTTERTEAHGQAHPATPLSSLLPSFLPSCAFFLVRTNSSNIEAPSPFYVFGVTSFNVDGELIRGDPFDGCDRMKGNYTGRVVWIEPYHCSIESTCTSAPPGRLLAAPRSRDQPT